MAIKPNSALVMVDLQNDFFPGGAWPVPYADSILPKVNEYIQLFWKNDLPIFASRDCHSPDAQQFTTNGGHLPPYCIQDSWGAEFHPDLQLPNTAIILTRGITEDQTGDSAYWGKDKRGHSLHDWLKALQLRWVYICGLPLETRVKETAIDTLRVGARASILLDATRARGSMPNEEEAAVIELVGRGVQLQSISQLRGR